MKSNMQIIETRTGEKRTLGEDARAFYDEGLRHLEEGRDEQAMSCLRQASERAPEHARIRSALGVAIARAERDFESSRALCESAVKQEFFNPSLYLNLARVYLEFDRRSEALRYLRRGQMIDPGHVEIQAQIAELGRRRMPVVPFLPRRHPLNRVFGTARELVLRPFDGR